MIYTHTQKTSIHGQYVLTPAGNILNRMPVYDFHNTMNYHWKLSYISLGVVQCCCLQALRGGSTIPLHYSL